MSQPSERFQSRSQQEKSRVFYYPILILAGVFLFFTAIASTSLWDNDEAIYSEIAKEMEEKNHWMTLMFNHHPWFCHPPLYMWCTAFLFKFFGASEFTARFFPAVFSILGLLAVFEFASFLWDRTTGFFAAVILATSLQYLVQGRMATMDSMLLCFLTLAFYTAWRGFEEKKKIWWRLFFLCASLATLTKGVFGLVYPIFIFGIFFLLQKEVREKTKEIPWFEGLGIYFVISVPWFAYESIKYGNLFLYKVFYYFTYERVLTPVLNQAGPWYYYIPILLFGFLPWSGFLPALFLKSWENRTNRSIFFLSVWVSATFIFFTLVQTKLPNYIFFLYPPLAMLLARFFQSFSRWEKALGVFLTLAVVSGLWGGLEILAFKKLLPRELSGYMSHLLPIVMILAGGVFLALLASLWVKREKVMFSLLAISISVFWLTLNITFSPIAESYKPMKPLAEKLYLYRQKMPEPVMAYHVAGTASLIFYGNTAIKTISRQKNFLFRWRHEKSYCFIEKGELIKLKKKMNPYWILGEKRTLCLLTNFNPGLANRN
jgi:4-amino-4-deoxy-L-arabinose transferase-like glycosyltransferase